MSNAFDILGDPVRRRILELLREKAHASGEVVAVIAEEFGVTQSAVSQQLRVLREAGFASVRRDGSRRIYLLETAPLESVDVWLAAFRSAWLPRLDALATEVARGKRARKARGRRANSRSWSLQDAGRHNDSVLLQPLQMNAIERPSQTQRSNRRRSLDHFRQTCG